MSVADDARRLRQRIAEMTLEPRLTNATQMLNAISSIGAPSVPDSGAKVNPPISDMELDAMVAEKRRIAMTPCPTGYTRNARGECVLLISSAEGLPLRTELLASTLTQNIPALGFEQVYQGTTVLPDALFSTELQGLRGFGALGFDLEDACVTSRQWCSTESGKMLTTLRGMLENCALFEADAGKTLTQQTVVALIDAIQAACAAGVASSAAMDTRSPVTGQTAGENLAPTGSGSVAPQASSSSPSGRRGVNWSRDLFDSSRQLTSDRAQTSQPQNWYGLGAARGEVPPCPYNVDAIRGFGAQFEEVKRKYESMLVAYPAARGACTKIPESTDTSGGGGGGGGTEKPEEKKAPPTTEKKGFPVVPFLIIGLTVGVLAAMRAAQKANRA